MGATAALPGGLGVRARVPKDPREVRISAPPPPRPAGRTPGRTTAGPAGRGPNPDGIGPLTALGVSLVLLLACVLGSLLDLALIGGPAWALITLYVAACGYTAARVRAADWFCALVAPPIAFGVAIILLAMIMPDSYGSGVIGTAATTFELLASKARSLYVGVALSGVTLLVRRAKARRPVGNGGRARA